MATSATDEVVRCFRGEEKGGSKLRCHRRLTTIGRTSASARMIFSGVILFLCMVYCFQLSIVTAATDAAHGVETASPNHDDIDVDAEIYLQSPPFVVSGYLPEYRYGTNLNASSVHLTDVMLFSLAPKAVATWEDAKKELGDTSTLPEGCCLGAEHYEFVREARAYKQQHEKEYQQAERRRGSAEQQQRGRRRLRLFLTIGGGGRSEGFVEISAGTKADRREFLSRLVKLCKSQQLDGIDFDWEGIRSMDEWKSYTQLLLEAANILHTKGLSVSVALHPNQFLPRQVCVALDRVHVMTYDMIGGDGGHHADYRRVVEAMHTFEERTKCPRSKLIMGIPAYGRHETDVGSAKTYAEIVDGYLASNNNQVQSGMVDNLRVHEGYRFDSISDVRRKVLFAKSSGFGGVFFWELGQDKRWSAEKGVGTSTAEGGVLLGAAAEEAFGRADETMEGRRAAGDEL